MVTRRIPSIHIFLTLDDIDPNTPDYQTTNVPTKFWPMPPKHKNFDDDDYARRNKRSHQHRGGGGNKFQKNQSKPSTSKEN